MTPQLKNKSIGLLKTLIATPSFSREEDKTAAIITGFLEENGVRVIRKYNNVWARSSYWSDGKPVILLNSHHDTVRPVKGWTRDPFEPAVEGDRLYGLGSNDAGGSLVSLIAAFLHFYNQKDLPFNLILAATAEEEISGENGVASILTKLGPIDMGIVGEPTGMQMAVAEKGLMVIDAEAKGKAGHAAREEGVNAIYITLEDIQWIRNYRFEKVSLLLGPVKMTVTQIEAGTQHNVVPDSCRFVIDVRSNEEYANDEIFDFLQKNTRSELKSRSLRLNSSSIPMDHPLVLAGKRLGLSHFGSPTLSDQALMPFPTLKIGPGNSARSHTADEYIRIPEIEEGIEVYAAVLEQLNDF
jgi:acetylornithine deacetylase